MAAGDICSTEFLCWLHEGFYRRLPDEFRKAEDEKGTAHEVQPGALRQGEVSVGRHMAPSQQEAQGIPQTFRRVLRSAGYDRTGQSDRCRCGRPSSADMDTSVPGWQWPRGPIVYPRLVCEGGRDSDGLWTISRGLARRKAEYQAALANADEKRMNDYDGRGYLSQRYLGEFCQFFLGTASDQVEFMQGLLSLEGMLNRITGYAERRESPRSFPEAPPCAQGNLSPRRNRPRRRGTNHRRITRTAQKVTGELLSQRLVTSGSPKGPLRLGFPADAAGEYFPNLYPAGAD